MDNEAGLLPVQKCGHPPGQLTAPISVIVLFAPGLERPYPLLPGEQYRICGACRAVFVLIDKAAEANETTAAAGRWTRAIVIFDDGHGVDVKNTRAAPGAQA